MPGIFENFGRSNMPLPSEQQAAMIAAQQQQFVSQNSQPNPYNPLATMGAGIGQAFGQRREARQAEERANIFNSSFEEAMDETAGNMQLAEIAAYTKAAGRFAAAGNRAAAQEMYQAALAADERRRAFELETAKIGGVAEDNAREINKMEDALRKEVDAQLGETDTVVNQIASLERNLQLNSPAGDLAGVFSYMKVLDPTSVVRESEFRTVEQAREGLAAVAAGQSVEGMDVSQEVAARVVSQLRGTRFTDITRAQIIDSARAAAMQRVSTSRGIISDALEMAESRDYDIESVRSGRAKSIQDFNATPLTPEDYNALALGVPLPKVLAGDYRTEIDSDAERVRAEARAILGMQ